VNLVKLHCKLQLSNDDTYALAAQYHLAFDGLGFMTPNQGTRSSI
jgi:hypothetical protein